VTASPALAQPDRDTRDPWERFGWIMGAIWLVFLLFPLASAITADTTGAGRAFAIVSILAFAGVYIYGFVRMGRTETWTQVNRLGWRTLAILVVLIGATSLVIGVDALGMVTFVVAFAMFTLPLATALGIGLTGIGAAVVVPLSLGVLEETWFFVPIVLMVGGVHRRCSRARTAWCGAPADGRRDGPGRRAGTGGARRSRRPRTQSDRRHRQG
jgi:two-component system sensor histidine kinase DesK